MYLVPASLITPLHTHEVHFGEEKAINEALSHVRATFLRDAVTLCHSMSRWTIDLESCPNNVRIR